MKRKRIGPCTSYRGRRRIKSRRGGLEVLEQRLLLISDWTNEFNARDVNRDSVVAPADVLVGIAELNHPTVTGVHGRLQDRHLHEGRPFFDVNGDGFLAPNDLLIVVNALNDRYEQPALDVRLANDTGPGATGPDDRITSAADLAGSLDDPQHRVTSLVATVDGGPSVTVPINGDGTFQFDPQLASDGTQDGDHSVRLTAFEGTLIVTARELSFTYDTTPPVIQLDAAGLVRETLSRLRVVSTEPLSRTLDPADARLEASDGPGQGETFPPDSVVSFGDAEFDLNYNPPLDNNTYLMSLAPVSDIAGNTVQAGPFQFQIANYSILAEVSPSDGDQGVSLTRDVFLDFDLPIDESTTAEAITLTAAGMEIATQHHLGRGGRTLRMTPLTPLPPSTDLRVTIDGDRLLGADGNPVAVSGSSLPGGLRTVDFRTVSSTRLPGTNVYGRVVASEPDGNGADVPLQGVTIRVDGFADFTAITDADGHFVLTDTPAPDFFVHIDGSTATHAGGLPISGDGFYPTVGKPFHSIPGEDFQIPFTIHLPFVLEEAMHELPADEEFPEDGVTIGLPETQTHGDAELEKIKLTVPKGSLVLPDGSPATRVGIFQVASDRLPAPLPPGADHAFDITIQTEPGAFFLEPAPIEFPNVRGLAPGRNVALISFNHSLGEWKTVGTMTVSADGQRVVSDPGSGILEPGWHWFDELVEIVGEVVTETERLIEKGKSIYDDVKSFIDVVTGLSKVKNLSDFTENVPVISDTVDLLREGLVDCKNLSSDKFENALCVTEMLKRISASVALGSLPLLVTFPNVGVPVAILGAGIWWSSELAGSGIQFARAIATFADCFVDKGDADGGEGEGNVSSSGRGDAAGAAEGEGEGPSRETDPAVLIAQIDEKLAAAERALNDLVDSLTDLYGRMGAALGVVLEAGIRNVIGPSYVNYYYELSESGDLRALDAEGNLAIDPATSQPFQLTLPDVMDRGELTVDELATIQDLLAPAQVDPPLAALGQAVPAIFGDPHARDAVTALELLREAIKIFEASRGGTYVAIAEGDGAPIYRTRSNLAGVWDARLPQGRDYTAYYFNPHTGLSSQVGFTVAAGTTNLRLEHKVDVLEAARPTGGSILPGAAGDGDDVDPDRDGLGPNAETAVGTRPDRFDTDGDAIDDYSEILLGLDPLGDRGFPTGVIASLMPEGQTLEVTVVAGETPLTSTAYLATGTHGLAIVDTSDFDAPILLGQLDLPGTAIDVGVDAERSLAAVAAEDSGLHLVDVSDPRQPVLIASLPLIANQVEVVGSVAFVGGDDQIMQVDLSRREIDVSLQLAAAPITGMAREGGFVYAMDDQRNLRVFDIRNPTIRQRGAVSVPDGAGKISVAEGIVYAAARNSNFRGGFSTIDVTNPDVPVVISGSDVGDRDVAPGTAIVPNGSGRGLLAGQPRSSDLPMLAVVDLSDPGNTEFLAIEEGPRRTILPAWPQGVALARGLAYVAGGDGGFHVVNYLPFDISGNAPSSTLLVDGDVDPDREGIQIEERSPLFLRVKAEDDLQVASVEFFLGDERAGVSLAAPFNRHTELPALGAGESSRVFSGVAVAEDTGGNVTVSAPVEIEIVPDTTGPAILSSDLRRGDTRPQGAFHAASVRFTERLDGELFAADAFRLFDDLGTAIPNVAASLSNDLQTVTISLPDLNAGDYQLEIDGTRVRDLAGNPLAAGTPPIHFSIASVDLFWNGEGDGTSWHDAANWNGDRLPTSDDDVLISTTANTHVVIADHAVAKRIVSDDRLSITNRTLTLTEDSTFREFALHNSGRLVSAAGLTITGSMQWLGGVVEVGGTLVNQGRLEISSDERKFLQGELSNEGDAFWLGGAIHNNGQATTFHNTAGNTLVISSSQKFVNNTSGPSPILLNDGTLLGVAEGVTIEAVLTNNGTIDVRQGSFHVDEEGTSSGTIRLAAGTSLHFGHRNRAADFEFLAGSVLIGEGTVAVNRGDVAFGDAYDAQSELFVGGNAQFSPGSRLPGNVTLLDGTITNGIFQDSLDWQSGTLMGDVRFAASAHVEIRSPAHKFFEGVLVNDGSVVWHDGNLFNNGRTAVVTNNGRWEGRNRSDFRVNTGSGIDPVFDNFGTYVQTAGDGELEADFTNRGRVDVEAGTLRLTRSGETFGPITVADGASLVFTGAADFLFQPGSTITGAGTLVAEAGSVALNDAYGMADLAIGNASVQLSDGSPLAGSLDLAGGQLTNGVIEGTAAWTGGALAGTMVVADGGELDIDGTGSKRLRGTLTNEGTMIWRDGTIFNDGLPVLIENRGQWEIATDDDRFARNTGSGANPSTENRGEIVRTGAGTTDFQGDFVNEGTIRLLDGTLAFPHGLTQHAGALVLAGGTLTATSFDVRGGEVRGSGTIDADVMSAGALLLDDPSGVLQINGNLQLAASGSIHWSIAPHPAQSARLQVLQTATIAGAASITFPSPPGNGTAHRLLSAAALSGLFDPDSVEVNGLAADQVFGLTYEALEVILEIDVTAAAEGEGERDAFFARLAGS